MCDTAPREGHALGASARSRRAARQVTKGNSLSNLTLCDMTRSIRWSAFARRPGRGRPSFHRIAKDAEYQGLMTNDQES
jgi:hypothetical protein